MPINSDQFRSMLTDIDRQWSELIDIGINARIDLHWSALGIDGGSLEHSITHELIFLYALNINTSTLGGFCRSITPKSFIVLFPDFSKCTNYSSKKALANKNAILVFAFQTPQHFMYFGWTFTVKFFSGVYHPQDILCEKVSSALAHWEHGDCDGITTNWLFHLRRLGGDRL